MENSEEAGVLRGQTPTIQQVLATPPNKAYQPIIIHRMTVKQMVYYQTDGQNPELIESNYSKQLQTGEEFYSRKTKTVAQQVTPLDLGWLADKPICSILIENKESGKTPDQSKVIEVKLGEISIMRIPPGESVRFNPVDAQQLGLYSETEAKFSINVIPG